MPTQQLKTLGEVLLDTGLFTPISTAEKLCDKHGIYIEQVFKRFIRGCPQCAQERQRELDFAEAQEREAAAKAHAQREINSRLGASQIPLRFQNKTIRGYNVNADNAQQASIVESVKAFAKEFVGLKHSGRCLAFLGNAGTGKTHLACAVGNHVIRNCGGTARFSSVAEIDRIVRQAKSFDNAVSESQVIESFGKYDLLIVDEVGIQSGTEAQSRALFDVFNERYQNLKPTILISNLGMAEFVAAVGERIADRLKEDGGEVLMFNWESAR